MKRYFSILALFLTATATLAQESGNEKDLVMYDPLFWKDELKLSTVQYQEIKEINRKFYEKVVDAYHEAPANTDNVKEQIKESLEDRSHRIWETLHSRQKRKLEKIVKESVGP